MSPHSKAEFSILTVLIPLLLLSSCTAVTPTSNTKAAETPLISSTLSNPSRTEPPETLPITQNTETPEPNNDMFMPLPTVTTGGCGNLFFPVARGLVWAYAITDSRVNVNNPNPYLQVEVAGITGTEFRRFTGEVQKPFEGSFADNPAAPSTRFFCVSNGIASELSGPGGIFLPYDLSEGAIWQEAFGTASEITHTSFGVEPVITLYFGTYDAIKIRSVSKSSKDTTTYRWYVEGVGIVKTLIEAPDYTRSEDITWLNIPLQ